MNALYKCTVTVEINNYTELHRVQYTYGEKPDFKSVSFTDFDEFVRYVSYNYPGVFHLEYPLFKKQPVLTIYGVRTCKKDDFRYGLIIVKPEKISLSDYTVKTLFSMLNLKEFMWAIKDIQEEQKGENK